jgi:endoglucanase
LFLMTVTVGGEGRDAAAGSDAAFALAAALGRGINLGNALEAPEEGDWGVVLEAHDFARNSAAGFEHVRLPVRWSAHAGAAPPYTIDPALFDRVDWALGEAWRNGMIVVLDVHHYGEMNSDPGNHRPRLQAIWRQIATHYAGAADEQLYFELLSGPVDRLDGVWNEVIAENLSIIRASNPTRPVIVGAHSRNSVEALEDLALPDDRMLILTFHNYTPMAFTHQGINDIEGAEAWVGTRWEGSFEEKMDLVEIFDQAERFAEAHGLPLYLGEFGSYEGADMPSRVRWTHFVRKEAERRGWSWAYWDYRARFGAFDRQTSQWHPILSALMPLPGSG